MANLSGTSGNDSLVGTAGDDTLNGLGGNDTLLGSGGTDFYDGGAGSDTLDVRTASAGVTINFANGTVGGGFNGTFVNMERALGSSGADRLIGAAGGQNLSARGGNDTLEGGAGVDTLWGGAGADSFVFRESGTANADRISDFASGSDKIVLDAAVMSALGASGNFAVGDARFSANSSGAAQDANDRIVFNTTTKQLFYDADGNGSGAAALIATLQSGSTLLATDIVVENGGGSGGGGSGGQTINGTAGNDSLVGTDGPDTINGLGGNDTLVGAAGRDLLNGGDGNDSLDGSNSPFAGTDPDVDTLDGGLGDDRFIVDNVADVLRDTGGVDTVVAINIDWTLAAGFEHLILLNETEIRQTGIGNNLANNISGTFVLLDGRGGDDTLFGASGPDGFGTPSVLRGGEGNDLITGQGEGDILEGGSGNDTVDGGPSATTVNGGAGNDLLTGGDDADTFVFDVAPGATNADQIRDFTSDLDTIRLDGNAHANAGPSGRFAEGDARFWSSGTGMAHDGDDRVIYNTATGELWYDADGSGAGARALIGTLQGAPPLAASDIEVINGGSSGSSGGKVINGTSANDTLSGTSGNDTINGLEGNDLFRAGSTGGNDVINGGAGRDSIEFKERATSAVVVDFAAGTITGGSSGTISFTSIERVLTGNFNDVLNGNAAAQTLTGQGGSDTLWGAGGVDTLWGASGADTFVFREMGTANADRISDFATGVDKLHLDDAAFTAIGAMGNFASGDGRFVANSSGTAQDAGDRVIFNNSTGALYYDADGSGAGAAPQLIATVQSGATVTATDIVVI